MDAGAPQAEEEVKHPGKGGKHPKMQAEPHGHKAGHGAHQAHGGHGKGSG